MSLITHAGGKVVGRDEVFSIQAPEPTPTWFPLSHGQVLSTVEEKIAVAGFQIERSQYALARNSQQFFGTLDLTSALAEGVKLAVGIRNSTNKTLPIGFAAGSRVFVCDNLAFSGEVVVARKHTKNGEDRFTEALARVVMQLNQFKQVEEERIKVLSACGITDQVAESLMLRAYEQDIISSRLLPDVISEWRKPQYESFKEKTLWSLFNCFTTVMGPRQASNPQAFAGMTMSLTGLISDAAGYKPQLTLADGTTYQTSNDLAA